MKGEEVLMSKEDLPPRSEDSYSRYFATAEKIHTYLSERNFKGNEPYDGLNTSFEFLKKTKFSRLILTHANKISPVNFRRVLGVKPYVHTKSLAILMNTYPEMYRLSRDDKYKEAYQTCKALLFERELKDGGVGGSYDYQMRQWLFRKEGFSSLGTLTAVKGLYLGYEVFKDSDDLKQARRLLNLVVERSFSQDDSGIHVNYATGQTRPIINVYAIALGALAQEISCNPNSEFQKLADTLCDCILSSRFANGAWPYVIGDKFEKTQIDFHQGFILDGLKEFYKYAGPRRPMIREALVKGCNFYRQYLFEADGKSLFRYGNKSPVDIHNQAQGILTFALCSEIDRAYANVSMTIAEWTKDNMMDKKGFFYYQMNPVYKNKIPYTAWSQCSMMMALVQLCRCLSAEGMKGA